jgi:uncharacterized phosphosugar-binding protein
MEKKMSRRSFILSSAAAGSLGKTALAQENRSNAGPKPKNIGEGKSYIDQYYYGTLKILKGIRETQLGNIGTAMRKAWELKNSGGKIYSHVLLGHYSMFAGSPDLPGQPYILPQRVDQKLEEDYAAMKKGDFLITNYANKAVVDARAKGVYVVGVTNNYVRSAKTPPGFLERDGMSTEEVSDLVIDSHGPYDNGLVTVPQIPEMKVCPSGGASQFLVYWPCTLILADLIGTNGKGSKENPAGKFLDLCLDRYQMIYTDKPKFDHVAETWADRVLNRKARLLVYGHHQKVAPYGGTVNTFVNDAYICSSSSMIADVYDHKADSLTANDIVFITSIFSNHPDEIDVARKARSAGAKTTAFCPFALEGDASGVRLYKEADDVFNTYCEEVGGVIQIPGFDKKIAPLTGLTGNLVHWMLMAQWTEHMVNRGEVPYFWKGYHEKGGRDYDLEKKAIFDKRGY